MMLKLPGPVPRSRRGLIVLAIILLVVGVIGITTYKKNNQSNESANQVEGNLSYSEYLNREFNDANNSIDKKDYETANSLLLLAAHDSVGAKEQAKAKNYFTETLKKIPQEKIRWSVYVAYADLAKATKDKTTEKSALDAAIKKGQAPDTDMDKAMLDQLNKRLASL